MRYTTKLRLQLHAMLLGIYGGLSAGAAYVAWRIYAGFVDGQITFGRHGQWLAARASEPFWFWFYIAWHGGVILCFLGAIAYFARSLGHGPWRSRGLRL